jgi:hypothetical protein
MNAPARQGIPLRPDPAAIAERARKSLARALLASARSVSEPDRNPHRIVARDWSHDDGAALILKTARAPTSTADIALLQTIIEAAVLGASGAGGELLRRGLMLSFGRAASISLPALIADASHGAFVGEGAPIPVYKQSIGTPTKLEPHKLMSIWTATREMLEGSNAEALITDCAKRSIGLTLDAHLFDDVAGDSVRPSGLRNGVAALTASAATDAYEKMLGDIGALLAAVAPVGGDVVLVANTARALMMPARSRGGTLPLVLGSPAVAAADLIAIAVDGLAAAIAPEIEVEASKGATIHMEDAAPLAISTAGAPATVAAPTRDLWTTDSVGLRLRLPVTWAKRHSAAVAWTTTTW